MKQKDGKRLLETGAASNKEWDAAEEKSGPEAASNKGWDAAEEKLQGGAM